MFLIRHAETAAPDAFHGAESDVELSAWGHRQAQLLADCIKPMQPKALYCSAMQRSVATAEPIAAACGLEPRPIASLHERRVGLLSGVSRHAGWSIYEQTKRRWIAGDLEFSQAEGESFADVQRRVVPIVSELAARHQGETFVVVCHGVVIRVMLISLIPELTPADFDRIAIDFASINDLRWNGTRWRGVAWNQVVAPSNAPPVA
jgi:probable phosphoglycerate mutase